MRAGCLGLKHCEGSEERNSFFICVNMDSEEHTGNIWRFVADKNKPKKRSDVLGKINIEIENMWSSK